MLNLHRQKSCTVASPIECNHATHLPSLVATNAATNDAAIGLKAKAERVLADRACNHSQNLSATGRLHPHNEVISQSTINSIAEQQGKDELKRLLTEIGLCNGATSEEITGEFNALIGGGCLPACLECYRQVAANYQRVNKRKGYSNA